MLRATQIVVDEGLAKPILVGRPSVVDARLARYGLSIRPGKDFVLINPEDDPRYREFVGTDGWQPGEPGAAPSSSRPPGSGARR